MLPTNIIRLIFLLALLPFVFTCQRSTGKGAAATGEPAAINERTANFPKQLDRVQKLPAKKDFWIFLLAGQSNMAGRGLVSPADTLSNPRILSIGPDNQWVYAKEPLHFYEPKLTGLDCGLSFARTLLPSLPDHVTIGLLPCAVGGSSITQWNQDVEHRGVKLFSNFKEKAALANAVGTIKGMLWHQGESDAHPKRIPQYREKLDILLTRLREECRDPELPIILGELGTYCETAEKQARWDSINVIINAYAADSEAVFHIDSDDLTSKSDFTHFDAPSQRQLGQRFAEKFLEILGEQGW